MCLGRLLIGYGLSKDLTALGVTHPSALQKDLMRCSKFQNRNGQARRLQDVAKQYLGQAIQAGKHSARSVITFGAEVKAGMHINTLLVCSVCHARVHCCLWEVSHVHWLL